MAGSLPPLKSQKSAVAALADVAGVRECLQFFARERQWINERHLEFCRIPAPTFRERQRAEWFAEQFATLGCAVKLDKAGNVLAWPGGESPGPYIAVTAHLDTVLAPRLPDDIQVRGDGRYHGPGVADNGAGLAGLLAIAAALDDAPTIDGLFFPFLIVANVGEEGEGNLSGMRYLCRNSPLGQKIRAFFVLDGPNVDHVTTTALASRRFEIAINGPGGHSWTDYGNANPVHALGRAIATFTDNKFNGGARCSYNFGVIEGGMSVNSIPTNAQAKLDLRSEAPEKIDEMSAAVTAALERALEVENGRALGGKLSAKVREIGSRPGGRLPEDARLLTALRAVDAYLNIRAATDCASTDANIPLSMGLEAVSIGAGGQGGGAHTPAEWYSPEGRETGLTRVMLAMSLMARAAQS